MKLEYKISILLYTVAIGWFLYWIADGMPDHKKEKTEWQKKENATFADVDQTPKLDHVASPAAMRIQKDRHD